MKNYIKTILLLILIFYIDIFSNFIYEAELSDFKYILTEIKTENIIENEKKTEKTIEYVYITKTGKCYHRENCFTLKSRIKISVEQLQNKKLRPCMHCMPDVNKSV